MPKRVRKNQYKKYGKKHYENNKIDYAKRNLAVKKRNRAFVLDIKRNGKCIDCGYSGKKHPEVLDFDHVKGKKRANVSLSITNLWSIDSIEKEIKKCVLRCANCHRIISAKRRKK